MALALRLLGRLRAEAQALIINPSLHLEHGLNQRVMQQALAFLSRFGVAVAAAQKTAETFPQAAAAVAVVIPKSG